MQMQKQDLAELISTVVRETITQLGLGKDTTAPHRGNEKTAYQKTEQLLFAYRGFQRIIEERKQEIEDLRKYGVPGKDGSIVINSSRGSVPQGLTLVEETVESAVRNVERSVEGTVQAIALIDKCMAQLADDPYYRILEMRYFEGRTQEDIAYTLNCTQANVSKNKSRLVRELSMRLFPNQAIEEMMN